MGMELHGTNRSLYLTRRAWIEMLKLARAFDWEPMGTRNRNYGKGLVPKELVGKLKWDGSYVHNGLQGVLSPDAKAMAAALQRALANPDHPAVRAAINLSEDFKRDYDKRTQGHYDFPAPLEGPHLTRDAIEEFIRFSRKGYFNIS
jgi:hypothetical protein